MNILRKQCLLSSLSPIFGSIECEQPQLFNLQMEGSLEQESCKMREVEMDYIYFGSHISDHDSLFASVTRKAEESAQAEQTPLLSEATSLKTVDGCMTNICQNRPEASQVPKVKKQKKIRSRTRGRKLKQKKKQKIRYQTKNIPKNFGKAIIAFIQKQNQIVKKICSKNEAPYELFMKEVVVMKRTINTMADLRKLWITCQYAKCLRIISYLFFRKYSFHYIFNSRINNFANHIISRHRIWDAIGSPEDFTSMKS